MTSNPNKVFGMVSNEVWAYYCEKEKNIDLHLKLSIIDHLVWHVNARVYL